jgi:hypothetical protein
MSLEEFFGLTNLMLGWSAAFRLYVLIVKFVGTRQRCRVSDTGLGFWLEAVACVGLVAAAVMRLASFGPWAHSGITGVWFAQASILQTFVVLYLLVQLAPDGAKKDCRESATP